MLYGISTIKKRDKARPKGLTMSKLLKEIACFFFPVDILHSTEGNLRLEERITA